MFQSNQQQLSQQAGQQIMPEPPRVISTKDFLYLTDALSWELQAMKMMHDAALSCTDPEISSYLHRAGQMHQAHYQQLLAHLNPASAANM